MEALVGPETIDVSRQASAIPATAAERSHMLIPNVEGRQGFGQRVLVALRIGTRFWDLSDIHDTSNRRSDQQLNEVPFVVTPIGNHAIARGGIIVDVETIPPP